MPIFRNIPISIPEKNILARLQFKNGITELDPGTKNLLDKIGREALSLIEPQGIYEIFPILSRTEEKINIKENLVIHSKQVSKLLAKCQRSVLLACTIGSALGARVLEYEKNGELQKAATLDAFGSELADEAADYLNKAAAWQRSRITSKMTMRYSPGYGDWNLEVQPEILALLDAKQIGLTSNASHILIPEKSVTAIVGIQDEV